MINLVELKNLHKTYYKNGVKTEALRGIDLMIEKGDIYGIIGLSGAGKSSLVRCINLLEKPGLGQVIVDGVDLTAINHKELINFRKKIGMIFQNFNLLMNSTVYENVAFPLKIANKPKKYIDQKVNEMLKLVGLIDKKYSYPAMLSGGQKQRVGIARALVGSPSILMCDEATSALDPTTTKSILSLIKDINKKMNITIIVITHEMEVVKQVCDKVAILEDGKIIESGEVLDVAENPKTKTGIDFFNLINLDIDNFIIENGLEGNGFIIKAVFIGELVALPLISSIISNYNVEVSILLGNIQQINEAMVGTLLVKVTGQNENIISSIDYLKEKGVKVEVIKT